MKEHAYLFLWKTYLMEQTDEAPPVPKANPETAKYPERLSSGIEGRLNFVYAVGSAANEFTGFFAEAAADIEKLKTLLTEARWTEVNDTTSGYTTYDAWKRSIGYATWELNDTQKQYWTDNVDNNAKTLSMTSPDQSVIIYTDTWNSYDAWRDGRLPDGGIDIRICKSDKPGVSTFKACASTPFYFNRNTYKDSDTLLNAINKITATMK